MAEAIARSTEETQPSETFTKDEADLSDLAGYELHEDGVAQAYTERFKDLIKYVTAQVGGRFRRPSAWR
jgi:hypothetical protein